MKSWPSLAATFTKASCSNIESSLWQTKRSFKSNQSCEYSMRWKQSQTENFEGQFWKGDMKLDALKMSFRIISLNWQKMEIILILVELKNQITIYKGWQVYRIKFYIKTVPKRWLCTKIIFFRCFFFLWIVIQIIIYHCSTFANQLDD